MVCHLKINLFTHVPPPWQSGEAFALGAGDLGTAPRSSHTSDLNLGTLVVTLPDA